MKRRPYILPKGYEFCYNANTHESYVYDIEEERKRIFWYTDPIPGVRNTPMEIKLDNQRYSLKTLMFYHFYPDKYKPNKYIYFKDRNPANMTPENLTQNNKDEFGVKYRTRIKKKIRLHITWKRNVDDSDYEDRIEDWFTREVSSESDGLSMYRL